MNKARLFHLTKGVQMAEIFDTIMGTAREHASKVFILVIFLTGLGAWHGREMISRIDTSQKKIKNLQEGVTQLQNGQTYYQRNQKDQIKEVKEELKYMNGKINDLILLINDRGKIE